MKKFGFTLAEGATHVDMSENFDKTNSCHCEGVRRPSQSQHQQIIMRC